MSMKKVFAAFITFVFILLLSTTANAGLASDMNSFFNNMGFKTNTTDATAYNGQESHYYSGGRIFARTPSHDVQFASIQLPSLRAGCNGIDAFTGAYSFVDSSELVSALKNIGNNAVGYFFQIALAVLTPEVKGVIDSLESWAERINSFNRNSCQMAQTMVNGFLSDTGIEANAGCINQGLVNNVYSDYADAKQNCGAGGQTNSTDNTLQKSTTASAATKENLWNNYNLTARIMAQLDLYKDNPDMQDIGLSVAGTIIRDNTSGQVVVHKYPPILTTEANWKALYQGGSLTVYQCVSGPSYDMTSPLDDASNTCLQISKVQKTINASDSFRSLIMTNLDSILSSIETDTSLTAQSEIFLNSVSLPVAQMLKVAYDYNHSLAPEVANKYAEIIGLSILRSYVSEILDNIQSSLGNINAPQKDTTEYIANLTTELERINDIYSRESAKATQDYKILQHSAQLKKLVASQLAEYVPSINFGG